MKVTVRVFGYLRTYCNRTSSEAFTVELPERSSAQNLLNELEIPEKEDIMVVVNNVTLPGRDRALDEGDLVLLYPFLGGG
jgi:molybdopterin converting factor small subunit